MCYPPYSLFDYNRFGCDRIKMLICESSIFLHLVGDFKQLIGSRLNVKKRYNIVIEENEFNEVIR